MTAGYGRVWPILGVYSLYTSFILHRIKFILSFLFTVSLRNSLKEGASDRKGVNHRVKWVLKHKGETEHQEFREEDRKQTEKKAKASGLNSTSVTKVTISR
jgi:hypothetical protein